MTATVEREPTAHQTAWAARRAAPPADYMAAHTFAGDRNHQLSVLYAWEYTWPAIQRAALEWAAAPDDYTLARNPEFRAVGPEVRVAEMKTVLERCGVTEQHLRTGGYLSGWLTYVRVRWLNAMRRGLAPAPVWRGGAWPAPTGDPLLGTATVTPHITYTHAVVIDGVEWGVQHLLHRMESIEDCDSERGSASLHGGGEDAVLADLLRRHAGLESEGGYHSAPTYDEKKWHSFRRRLQAVAELR